MAKGNNDGGGWTTVKRRGKGKQGGGDGGGTSTKNKNKKKKKNKAKDEAEQAVVDSTVVTESAIGTGTIYSRYEEEMERKAARARAEGMVAGGDMFDDSGLPTASSGPEKRKKKPRRKRPPKPQTFPLISRCRRMNLNTLRSSIRGAALKYPGSFVAQFKTVCQMLEEQLADVVKATRAASSMDMATFAAYPKTEATPEFLEVLTEWMDTLPAQDANSCFVAAAGIIRTIDADEPRLSGVGVRVLMQILVEAHPDVVVSNVRSILAQRGNNIDDASVWMLSQAIFVSPQDAFAAWCSLIAPALVRAEAQAAGSASKKGNPNQGSFETTAALEHAVGFVPHLFSATGNTVRDWSEDPGYQDLMTPDDLVALSRAVLPAKGETRVLGDLVPFFGGIMDATVLYTSGTMRRGFSTILRLCDSPNETLNAEACRTVLAAATLDEQCGSIWAESYFSNMVSTQNVLVRLNATYPKWRGRVNPAVLGSLLDTFQACNDALLTDEATPNQVKKFGKSGLTLEDLQQMNRNIKVLLERVESSESGGSFFWTFLMLALVVLIGVVSYFRKPIVERLMQMTDPEYAAAHNGAGGGAGGGH